MSVQLCAKSLDLSTQLALAMMVANDGTREPLPPRLGPEAPRQFQGENRDRRFQPTSAELKAVASGHEQRVTHEQRLRNRSVTPGAPILLSIWNDGRHQ